MIRERLDALAPGLVAGIVAVALAVLALVGTAALGAGVFVVQIVVALAWLAVLDARGGRGAFLLAVAAAVAADVTLGLRDSADLGDTAVVAGVAVVASFLHQLARRPRPGVTLSLATTLSAVTLALAASGYLALERQGTGDKAVAAALFGVGAAIAVARLVDLALPRPGSFAGSRRGLAGVLLGCVAAAVVGGVYGSSVSGLTTGVGLRMGLIAALLALIADIAVDLVLTQAPPQDERRLSALTPLSVLLPVVLSGPVAYLAGRILLG